MYHIHFMIFTRTESTCFDINGRVFHWGLTIAEETPSLCKAPSNQADKKRKHHGVSGWRASRHIIREKKIKGRHCRKRSRRSKVSASFSQCWTRAGKRHMARAKNSPFHSQQNAVETGKRPPHFHRSLDRACWLEEAIERQEAGTVSGWETLNLAYGDGAVGGLRGVGV